MAKRLPIITVPDPKLREKSLPVVLDQKTGRYIQDLGETLLKKNDPPGVGLSAIQTGVKKRLFFTFLPPQKDLKTLPHSLKTFKLHAFINPVVTDLSDSKTLGPDPKNPTLEGCLSIPSLYGPVWRPEWIEMDYYTMENSELAFHHNRFSFFAARVIMHEYDHLEGILFTDYTLKDDLPIFFEQEDELIPVHDPSQLIRW